MNIASTLSRLDDVVMEAWGIIANAGGGDWNKESIDWRRAAARFRDKHVASTSRRQAELMRDEHRQRHVELHNAFDELLADYLDQHRDKRPSDTTMFELIEWSHAQTLSPTAP